MSISVQAATRASRPILPVEVAPARIAPVAAPEGPSEGIVRNTRIITDHYAAFARHDGPAMARGYASSGTFEDPVFGKLSGADAGLMWRMLLARSDLRLTYSVTGTATGGIVRWQADYTLNGRPVHNEVTSTITLDAQGRINRQVDDFNLGRWLRQARDLPWYQVPLTWNDTVARKVIGPTVQKSAREQLEAFRRATGG